MVAEAPGSRVFISYRREDSGYPAGWLFDQLAASLGADRVFKDADSIEPVDDFAEVISDAVSSCAVLAVIGDRWLAAADEDGRRLDDPGDFVRLEIEAALTRGVRVIPVLVGGRGCHALHSSRPASLPYAAARRSKSAMPGSGPTSQACSPCWNGRSARRQPCSRPSPAQTRQAVKVAALQDVFAALPASIVCFRDDDAGFLRWREDNPDGFFLNTERKPRPGNITLHGSATPTSPAALCTGPRITSSSAHPAGKPWRHGRPARSVTSSTAAPASANQRRAKLADAYHPKVNPAVG
jgi:hypothetical protein